MLPRGSCGDTLAGQMYGVESFVRRVDSPRFGRNPSEMNLHRNTFFSLCLAFVWIAAVFSPAVDKQQVAATLVSRAATQSDIRATGSLPFRLRAELKAVGGNTNSANGSYTETWLSAGQWRRETIIGDEHRIEVISEQKRYLSDPLKGLGLAGKVQFLMNIANISTLPLRVSKIKDGEITGLNAQCVIGQPETLCFDKENGRLLSRTFLTTEASGRTEWFCQYGDYQEFGNKSVPRAISCAANGKLRLQIRVAELSQQDHTDLKLFQPPEGATESEFLSCNRKTPPQVLSTPDPDTPHGFGSGAIVVTLSVTVDENGHVRDPHVTNSGGPQSDHWAIDNVLGWRYKPATCDGVPISTEINILFTIRHGH
jgi:TonB family protein